MAVNEPVVTADALIVSPKHRLGKNPTVDTSWLPDADREEEERQLKYKLRQEWLAEQERLKALPLNITYSYWDGHGHRREITVKQGNTIETFLRAVQRDFPELAGSSTSDLLYIKEDLIIPNVSGKVCRMDCHLFTCHSMPKYTNFFAC